MISISWSSVGLDEERQEEEGGRLVEAWLTGAWWRGGGGGTDPSWIRLLAVTRTIDHPLIATIRIKRSCELLITCSRSSVHPVVNLPL